ncbi:spondin domain-containing protein [Pelagicoccus enzymogenes]|uniref:spondin domain-containing protein n=1 Tax=Pelagicoccus enzymogenes TaxID=2773457 RepID=UPI00280E6A0D|nr:spondin domain-containing protein [Pelagicoccus enzymogenes]MDQ8196726.1 spondin domain-containing protein [Pelagicoccus enzymogenes]
MYKLTRTLSRAAVRGLAAAACFAAVSAHAINLKIKVENLSEPGGLWLTPFFLGFHDGGFDLFDEGSAASPGLEMLAEDGVPNGLASEIAPYGHSAVLTGSDGPPGVLFAPGSMAYTLLSLNPGSSLYFNFASMVIPSNDAFLGNDMAHMLFDGSGNFTGNISFDLYGRNVWDAGTEANDTFGAAFSTLGGTGTPTSLTVEQHGGLVNFEGSQLPAGLGTLNTTFGSDTPLARISVEQVPDSTQYIGLMGAIALIGFRYASKRRMGQSKA